MTFMIWNWNLPDCSVRNLTEQLLQYSNQVIALISIQKLLIKALDIFEVNQLITKVHSKWFPQLSKLKSSVTSRFVIYEKHEKIFDF